MTETMNQSTKKRRGRRPVDESKKLVLVGGKVPPEIKKCLEDIGRARDWSMSEIIRAACEALVKKELRRVT